MNLVKSLPAKYCDRGKQQRIALCGITLVLSIAVLNLVGCVQYGTLNDWYSTPKITALSGLEPVAVYQFSDRRGVKETFLGSSAFEVLSLRGGRVLGQTIESHEPVAAALTQAFAEGLRSRGFSLHDMSTARFEVGSPLPILAPVALTGQIFDLQFDYWDPAFSAERGMTRCHVKLQAYESASGRLIWEKDYAKTFVFGPKVPERGEPNKTPLGRVVADVVQAAVYDPELIVAIGRKRDH